MRAPHIVLSVGLVIAAAVLAALWWTSDPDQLPPGEPIVVEPPFGPAPTRTPVSSRTEVVPSAVDAGSPREVESATADRPAAGDRPRVEIPVPPERWPESIRPSAPRTVTTPPPEDLPAVSKEDIKRAIESVKPLIAQCFHDAAAKNAGDQKVKLKFTIEGRGVSGRFNDGEVVESTIVDPWVQACFLEALTDADFPAPSGGGTVTVTYPFSFVADAGT